MKRSQINAIIQDFESMLQEYRFALPPFLSFTPEEWQNKGHEYDEIRDNALGWDITDYGEGKFFENVHKQYLLMYWLLSISSGTMGEWSVESGEWN